MGQGNEGDQSRSGTVIQGQYSRAGEDDEKTEPGAGRGRSIEDVEEGPKSKERQQWKRVDLGQSDKTLLRIAHEQKFVTFEQALKIYGQRPWNKRPDHPVMKRLRKLEHFGLIERVRVFTQKHAVILVGKDGYQALCLFEYDRGLARAGELDLRDFNHDKTVTDIRLRTSAMNSGKARFRTGWTSERVLRHDLGSKAVPDAVMVVAGQGVAIELERSRKKQDRYESILRRHLNQMKAGVFSKVLFVVEDDGLLRWLLEEGLPRGLSKAAEGRAVPPERWRFVTLGSLMDKGELAPMYLRRLGHARPRCFTLADLAVDADQLEARGRA